MLVGDLGCVCAQLASVMVCTVTRAAADVFACACARRRLRAEGPVSVLRGPLPLARLGRQPRAQQGRSPRTDRQPVPPTGGSA